MKPWSALTLREKTQYCLTHRLTLLTGRVRYENEYKLFKSQENESIR